MIVSNEPGYYKVGDFGIRIENLVLVKHSQRNKEVSAMETEGRVNGKSEGKGTMFCELETISLVPLQKKLIDPALLTKASKEWVDQYHATCFEVVGKKLKEFGKEEAHRWLRENTLPLEPRTSHTTEAPAAKRMKTE